MARLGRAAGVGSAKVNLPGLKSVGPALLKTGETGQAIAQRRGANKRTQEAQLAASLLNFERDGEGNLLPPALPIGANGLVAPTIYDQEYSKQVFNRYAQQSELDVTAMMSALASQHPFDPEGFKLVSKAYIDKVTELAPDQIKGSINLTAQVKSVEHFNFIARQTAERDYNASVLTYNTTIKTGQDGIISSIMAGEDFDSIEAKYLAQRELIQAGMVEHNFYTEPEIAKQILQLDFAVSASTTMHEITNLQDDELDLATGLARLKSLANGEGDILAMVDGKMKQVPIAEAFPGIEDQMAISAAAQTIMANKSAAFNGQKDAEHAELENDYLTFKAGHFLSVSNGLIEFDRPAMERFHAKALQQDNPELANRIYTDIMSQVDTGGANKTEIELGFFIADHMRRRKEALEKSDRILGPEGVANLSDEQKLERDRRIELAHPLHLDQIEEYQSKWADPQYDSFVNEFPDFDPFASDLERPFSDSITKAYINGVIKNGGDLIPSRIAQGIVNNLRGDVSNEQVYSRTLEIVYELWKDNGTKRNLRKSLPSGMFNALDHMFSYTAPSNITPTQVQEEIRRYDDPTYRPHKAWVDLELEERAVVVEETEDMMRDMMIHRPLGPFDGVQGTQVNAWWGTIGEIVGTQLPSEVQMKIYRAVEQRASWFDSSDTDHREIALRNVVDEMLFDWGYAPSKFGWNEANAVIPRGIIGTNRPYNAIAERPPEFLYRNSGRVTEQTKDSPTNVFVMKEIEKDFNVLLAAMQIEFPTAEKFIAGENAYLVYDQQHFDNSGKDRYEIIIFDASTDLDKFTAIRSASGSGLGLNGVSYTIDFELSGAVGRGMKAFNDDFAAQAEANRLGREKQQLGGFNLRQ